MGYEPDIDPGREYDLYCERQERAYQARIAEATCGDCANCTEPGKEWENPDRIGWCEEMKEFVGLDDSPREYECEDFE